MNSTNGKTITIYPLTYSKMGRYVLAERLNISMDILEDSVAIYKINKMYEVVAHGHYGDDIIDTISEAIAERSNN